MNTVTIVNLNGKAYKLEETGAEALRAYLETARQKLSDDPDKEEILKDFEQAIAEKFDTHITVHKNVVTTETVLRSIEEMGPVHSESAQTEESTEPSDTKTEGTPKRLYRIKEESKVWGVCTGLAAYFNIDVTIVRIAFVIFTLISNGFGVGVYIVLALVIPLATTNAEKASARGAHFNAHEFIESLRKMYAEHRPHKQTERAHRRHNENWRRVGRSLSGLAHLVAGTVAIACSIALGVLTVGAVATLWSFLTTGLFFGYPLLFGASSILLVIFVAALYYIPAWILILIIRESRRVINPREEGPRDIWSITAGAVSWGIAIAIVITIFALSFPRFDHTQTPYGFQFNVKHRHVCVGGNNYCAVPVVSEVLITDVAQ